MELIGQRISELLEQKNFEFNINYLDYIHYYLFKDILSNSGHHRTYDIYKPEYTLNGESISYESPLTIDNYLSYIFKEEEIKNCYHINIDELILKIANLNVRLWKIHPYIEGNTRAISVFIEKILRKLGYNVNNDIFKENHLYYRFSLVKAAYINKNLGKKEDMLPLIKFYKKLLIDHNIILKEEYLFEIKLFNKNKKKEKIPLILWYLLIYSKKITSFFTNL